MGDLVSHMACIRGPGMEKRRRLAPLTNLRSHPDVTLSFDEHRWLTFRAQGGFGLTMTAAAHVQRIGQGFPGQVGIFSDVHIPGLARPAEDIRKAGRLAFVQLHHARMRSPSGLNGQATACPPQPPTTGPRPLHTAECPSSADRLRRPRR